MAKWYEVLGVVPFLAGRANKNPAAPARPYLEQMPDIGRQAYNPYIQQGQEAYGKLPDYAQMANKPEEYISGLLKNFETSPGYQRQLNEALNASEAAATSGGYAGAYPDVMERQKIARDLMGQEQDRYLNRIINARNFGTAGLEGILGRGFQSSSNLADFLGTALANRANLEFAGSASKNQSQQDLYNNLLTAAMMFAGLGGGEGAMVPKGQGGGNNIASIAALLQMLGYGQGGQMGSHERGMNQPGTYTPLSNLNRYEVQNNADVQFGLPGYRTPR